MKRLVLPVLVAISLGGCGSPQDFMHPAGPAAGGLAHLGWIALVCVAVAIAIMWILLGVVALRPRGSLSEHAPVDANGGQRWVLFGGFLAPLVVLVVLFGLTLRTLGAYPMETAPRGFICRADRSTCPPASIRITGRQWWFNATYLFDDQSLNLDAPTEIHVPVGTSVVLELVTQDVIHSFWVPKLHGKVDLIPGQVNAIEIQADMPGTYQGECAEFCGAEHAKMRLLVVAEKAEAFQQWLAGQRAVAAVSDDATARRGHDVFMNGPCIVCHTIRGTEAHGLVGPDLTHLASRQTIAGGTLPNQTANLAAWITHAQSLKPGAMMPDMTAFNGDDLRALVAYLQTLR